MTIWTIWRVSAQSTFSNVRTSALKVEFLRKSNWTSISKRLSALMDFPLATSAALKFRTSSSFRISTTALLHFSSWLRNLSCSSNSHRKVWTSSNTMLWSPASGAQTPLCILMFSSISSDERIWRKLTPTTSSTTSGTPMANIRITKSLWRWKWMKLFKRTAENLKRSMDTNGSHLLWLGFWITDQSRYSPLWIRCKVKYRWEMVSFSCSKFHQALAQK